MNESDVADFLLANPQFFDRHPDMLSRLQLGNPHGGRVVSLAQRQIEVVREKNRQLERRLNELVRYGHENDGYATRLDRLATQMLLTDQVAELPEVVCDGLRDHFDVPSVALRLWVTRGETTFPDFAVSQSYGWARPIDASIRTFATSLTKPYCGKNNGFAAASWLDADALAAATRPLFATDPLGSSDGATLASYLGKSALDVPGAGSSARESRGAFGGYSGGDDGFDGSGKAASLAMIALRSPNRFGYPDPDAEAFGLIVLGSPDPNRFHSAMATDLLSRIGVLASAALCRVLR